MTRSYLRLLIIPITIASALVGLMALSASGATSDATIKSVASGNWSDRATWDVGRVPAEGDHVLISPRTNIMYDAWSAAEIREITIDGALRFSRTRDTNLDVGTVTVRPSGKLEIGTAKYPIPSHIKARIRIINSRDGENSIEVFGEAQIHGSPMNHVFTHLSGDAEEGSQVIFMEDSVDWKPGDRIVIASTTQRPKETELNAIKSIRGKRITLARPLRYRHGGFGPAKAEVANLTRNVVITSKNPRLRGHTRFLHGAKGSISYAEFVNLGAVNQLGKYPIHFHMVGNSMKGSYVKGASIWNSGNRFITVHSSNFVTLSDNVGFNGLGHGFFMEEGDEVFVTWRRNIGLRVRPGKLINSDRKPSVFWAENPMNIWTSNVAVGSVKGYGFNLHISHRKLDISGLGGPTELRKLPVLKFSSNVAHSNSLAGLRIYRLNSGGGIETSRFENLELWRNGEIGIILNAVNARLESSTIFGNGKFNVVLRGQNNVVDSTHIFAEPVDQILPRLAANPTLVGILLIGTDHLITDSVLEGHNATSSGDSGTDIKPAQDTIGAITATVRRTLLKSDRPIIFGYPMNQETKITVEDFQGVPGDDFVLSRFDSTASKTCLPTVSMLFVASVCRPIRD